MIRCSLSSPSRLVPALACTFAMACSDASAQCTTPWAAVTRLAGVDGAVDAMTVWDRDGAGPLPPLLVVGGTFTTTGDGAANNIATYEPVGRTWAALGSGVSGAFVGQLAVHAFAVLPNGDLVAAGQFLDAGGVACANIARWNGTSWSPFANGIGGPVHALAVAPNGDLFAAGEFFFANGVACNNVARWNGSNWSPLGSGTTEPVYALAIAANGDLFAGGNFVSAGGTTVNRVARWNGAVWSPLGSGTTGAVNDLLVLPNGDLVATGAWSSIGGVSADSIARWNGTTWSAFGTGCNGAGYALAPLAGGGFVVAGNFGTAGGVPALHVAAWNGTAWSGLAGGLDGIPQALAQLPNGDVVAGGPLLSPIGGSGRYVARWNGTAWSQLNDGIDQPVYAVAELANGDLLAGGAFTQIGSTLANRIARRVGSTWQPLGTGVNGVVVALLELSNGDIVAGGSFLTAGGVAASRVARWNGTSWSPLGLGLPTNVLALAALQNGDIVAACLGNGGIVRWNGGAWVSTGVTTFAPANQQATMRVLANGDLVVHGAFIIASGAMGACLRWDGTTWSALTGIVNVSTIDIDRNGDLLAAGTVGTSPSVARWTGASWQPIAPTTPGGPVGVLRQLPSGDLLAGGWFLQIGGMPIRSIARWDGATWSAVDGGTSGSVAAFASLANGDVVVAGDFTLAGGVGSPYLARLTTTCPALAAPSGAGCSGSGGQNVLAATSLPWIGGTFRSVASGMPANGLAIEVRGLGTASVPLSSILPQGLPGCSLLATPDMLSLLLPAAGSAAVEFPIPNAIALVGAQLYQQVAAIQLAGGSIAALTSTNALSLTIGAF